MKLVKGDKSVTPDERGSLTLRYECPECLMEVAMLTNPFETQLVTSLGVEIGGKTLSEKDGFLIDAGGKATGAKNLGSLPTEAKCPFSQVARDAIADGAERAGATSEELIIPWTAQAMVRLQNIPEFVRPMAKQGIEQFAREKGFPQVNEKCLDEAKEEFGM